MQKFPSTFTNLKNLRFLNVSRNQL
ncbi:MAG: hypothetical protein GF317_17340 [Candidatus Lokiarchaeota archaeon]|nr:hypothetical protein [Candidatus Lokiarchaeota archaeon]MBD3201284.1 hypothetical protein [Candidatus Lokiarchaeota archaeon]